VLKTSLKFFINPLFKFLVGGAVLAPPFLTLASESSQKFPGIIESLETLIDIDRANFSKKMQIIAKSPKLGVDLNKISNQEIDPDFIQSLVFHSDKKVLSMIGQNPCAFYALLETNLLKNSSGVITDVMIRYPSEKDYQYALIPKNDFTEKIYRNTCQDNPKLKQKYQTFKIAETINALPILSPQIESECSSIIDKWQKNPEMPYLCDVMDLISKGEKAQAELMRLGGSNPRARQDLVNQLQIATTYSKQISANKLTYFKNLCDNLGSTESFCRSYFNQSYWNKALTREGVKADLEKRCQNILSKTPLEANDYKSCVGQLNKNADVCHYEKSTNHNSLTPKPNCELLSKALNVSRLYRDYADCPAYAGSEGIINAGRVLFHISEDYRKNFIINGENPTMCFTKATAAFAKINLDYELSEAWGVKACYQDKINEKEACFPTLMGSHPSSDFSEEKVIHKILMNTKGAEKNGTCEVLSISEYNPALLKYRYGCFLIYDPAVCNGIYCPKKIIFNERPITHITYKYGTNFDYFPNTIAKERYAFTGLIDNQLKISTTRITNVTTLRFYLNQSPTYLIHGMGCIEDLLPSFFQKKSMNACTPISFIVDGMLEKSGRASLIVRTSIDDLHSPRIIDWNLVYSAVREYQEFHPLKIWGLYVLKK
jgi:hypothetical protein